MAISFATIAALLPLLAVGPVSARWSKGLSSADAQALMALEPKELGYVYSYQLLSHLVAFLSTIVAFSCSLADSLWPMGLVVGASLGTTYLADRSFRQFFQRREPGEASTQTLKWRK